MSKKHSSRHSGGSSWLWWVLGLGAAVLLIKPAAHATAHYLETNPEMLAKIRAAMNHPQGIQALHKMWNDASPAGRQELDVLFAHAGVRRPW